MLELGAGSVGLFDVGLDVAYDRDDVHLEPQAGAEVGDVLEEVDGDTCADEFAGVLVAEGLEGLEDVLGNSAGVLFETAFFEVKGGGSIVGAVSAVVDGYSHLDVVVFSGLSSDTSPHGLYAS